MNRDYVEKILLHQWPHHMKGMRYILTSPTHRGWNVSLTSLHDDLFREGSRVSEAQLVAQLVLECISQVLKECAVALKTGIQRAEFALTLIFLADVAVRHRANGSGAVLCGFSSGRSEDAC